MEDNNRGSKYKDRNDRLLLMRRAALLCWVVLIIIALINRDKISIETVLSLEPSSLWLAAAFMLALFALKTLSVVFYSGILFTVSGIMFDLPAAIAVNTAGALVMLIEGYLIGKAAGSGLVDRLSAKYPKFAAFTGVKRSPFAFALLIRMLKLINYDLGSMYMGAAGVKILPYLGGSLTAMLPEIILFALAGSGIADMDAMPASAAAVIYIVMTLVSVPALRYMMKKN